MQPKPHRRDRRGAARTERLQEALLWPDRSERSTRKLVEKRAAFARHQARYAPAERPMVVSVLFLGLVAVVVALAAIEFGQSRHLVAYASAPTSYRQLVAEATANCGDDICWFGWFDEPPTAEMKRLMSDVRARRVTYDPWTATTVIQGGHDAAFRLVHESPTPTPEQAHARAFAHQQAREQRARAIARGSLKAFPEPVGVGQGWKSIASR